MRQFVCNIIDVEENSNKPVINHNVPDSKNSSYKMMFRVIYMYVVDLQSSKASYCCELKSINLFPVNQLVTAIIQRSSPRYYTNPDPAPDHEDVLG